MQTATTPAVDYVTAERTVRSVYQPIVDLDSGAVAGWEALARGPVDSPLERPDRLFAAAEQAGRLTQLDWECRVSAVRGALDAGIGPRRALFINVEPRALGTPAPDHLASDWQRAADELDVVVEITERSLTERPADLLAAIETMRARGWRIALDDVGADARSLALMPLLRPDVIKLDLRL